MCTSNKIRVYGSLPMKVDRLVCLSAGLQKTPGRMSTQFGLSMGLSPEETSLTYGADQDKGTETGVLSHFL